MFKLFLFTALLSLSLQAATPPVAPLPAASTSTNLLDELDPFDPHIEQKLEEYDRIYEQETGQPSHLTEPFQDLFQPFITEPTCVREACDVWAQVVKSTQTLYLFVHGELTATWKVSTGIRGRETPSFDRHPNGRIYDRYTSTKFPGGDYKNLGNMPYAVFIDGGFAIHGTGEGNWKKLGTPASHGCIRVHPDNAFYFNRLVRKVGAKAVWVTVQN